MMEDASNSWYYHNFTVPGNWSDQRVLLNFGAIDYDATVFVNGKQLGSHLGGYTSFTMDITEQVSFGEDNEM
jgi:beta-galactosidase/beta-glucuronidase